MMFKRKKLATPLLSSSAISSSSAYSSAQPGSHYSAMATLINCWECHQTTSSVQQQKDGWRLLHIFFKSEFLGRTDFCSLEHAKKWVANQLAPILVMDALENNTPIRDSYPSRTSSFASGGWSASGGLEISMRGRCSKCGKNSEMMVLIKVSEKDGAEIENWFFCSPECLPEDGKFNES